MSNNIFPLLRDWKLMYTFGNSNPDCVKAFCFTTSIKEEDLAPETTTNDNNDEKQKKKKGTKEPKIHIPENMHGKVFHREKKGWDIELNCRPRELNKGTTVDKSKMIV
jgi:hypothetical protein